MVYKKKITWTTCYENMLTMAKMKIGELKGGWSREEAKMRCLIFV